MSCLILTWSIILKPCRATEKMLVFHSLNRMTVFGSHCLSTEKIVWGFSSQWKKMESHRQYAGSPFIKILLPYSCAELGNGSQCFAIQYSYSTPTESRGANSVWVVHLLQVGQQRILLESWSIPLHRENVSGRLERTQPAAYWLQQYMGGVSPHWCRSQNRL